MQQQRSFPLDQGKVANGCADIIKTSQYLVVVGCFKSGLINIFRRNLAGSGMKQIFQKEMPGFNTRDVRFIEYTG